MKTSFNLRKHLKKKAFYEGAQELMRPERKMADCQKKYRDQGMGAQEAWDKCHRDYDHGNGNIISDKNKGNSSSPLE